MVFVFFIDVLRQVVLNPRAGSSPLPLPMLYHWFPPQPKGKLSSSSHPITPFSELAVPFFLSPSIPPLAGSLP